MGVAGVDEDQERTYSPWVVLAVFLVIGAVGLAGFLLFGGGTSPTEQLDVDQTTSTTTTTTTTTLPPVTAPGGEPVPEGVQDVLVDGGVTSYAFTTPAALAQVPIRTVVPRSTATPSEDGTRLTVVVECSVGVGEALAQLTVTEDTATVTVLPVTIAPADAPPCPPGAEPRTVTVPLTEPLGTRSVIVVPGGTEVPTPVAR
jgi:hypothetical protein